jgi:hypothetical protein
MFDGSVRDGNDAGIVEVTSWRIYAWKELSRESII